MPAAVQMPDLHAVLGQRAGLVGADHRGRAERLDRAESLDERALRERGRGRRRPSASVIVGQQTLGHVGDQQADGEHGRGRERQARGERAERQERDADGERDERR